MKSAGQGLLMLLALLCMLASAAVVVAALYWVWLVLGIIIGAMTP